MPLPLLPLVGDVWRGRTILRSLEDRALRERVILRGLCLDLGGAESGYLRSFRRAARVTPIVVDIRPESGPDVVADLEYPLPFGAAVADTVLLHNVLEHVRAHQVLIAEMHRILKPGGRAYFTVPFLVPLHELVGGYRDYHRFTADALEPMFGSYAGVQIVPIEVGPFLAALHVAFSALPFRLLRAASVVAAWGLDRVYAAVRRRRDPRTRIAFVLGYVGTATA